MKRSFIFILCATFCLCFLSGCQTYSKFPQNLNKYNIIATFDEETNVLNAEQTVRYVNSTDTTLSYIMFNLYPNAFAQGVENSPVSLSSYVKAYSNGASYGNITIKEVMVDEIYNDFILEGVDKTFLKVVLNEALYPDESVNIFISYEEVLPNVLHRYGYGDNTYNFGNFYPIVCVYDNGWVCNPYSSNGDPFYSDVADYEVSLTVNSNFVLAHTGNQTKKEVVENITTYTLQAKAVRDFAFVLSKEFSVINANYENIEIKYFYFNDENYEKSIQAGIDAIKTFNNLFGKYPYSTLHIVQSNFVHGGMEYPNLIYISDSVTALEDYLNVIIHETAHQWWYGVVGNDEFSNPWLDESLTEYSTILFYEENPQYNQKRETLVNNASQTYNFFVDVYSQVYGEVDKSMTRNLSEYKTGPEYVYMTYVKGMLMFDGVRDCVGKKRFIKTLKKYYEDNKYQNATPERLISTFEKTC